jgi:hypothetical protein
MTSYISKYQLKHGKCFECFTLDMTVYVGVQWNIKIIVVRGHELDTWHGNKNANKKVWSHIRPKGYWSDHNYMLHPPCMMHLQILCKTQM